MVFELEMRVGKDEVLADVLLHSLETDDDVFENVFLSLG